MKLLSIRSVGSAVVAWGAICATSMTLWAVDATMSASPAGATSPSMGGGTAGGNLSSQDAQFLNDLAKNNAMQITIGFLAIEKGSTDDVKKFGRDLIDSRIKSNKNLMELASRKNLFIPLGQMEMKNDQINQISQQPGAEFDKAFIKLVISENAKAQSNLQRYLSQVQDKDTRDFANQNLSDVGDRLSDARDLGGNLGLAAQDLNPTLPPVGEESTPIESPTATPSGGESK